MTYVSRKLSRRTARSTVIQPRGGAWSGRTISSCSPSRHHYRSPPDSRSSPRRISPTACLELSATRETRLFPAQLSSRISLSPSRRKRPAVIRAKESTRGPPPPLCTCQARDSASTMHRYARKLQFRRDKTERRSLARVAHLFVHHRASSLRRSTLHRLRPRESSIDTRRTEESAICESPASGNWRPNFPTRSRSRLISRLEEIVTRVRFSLR